MRSRTSATGLAALLLVVAGGHLHAAGKQAAVNKNSGKFDAPVQLAQADPTEDALPLSRDELFGTQPADESGNAPASTSNEARPPRRVNFRGFTQLETAFTYPEESHWSRGVLRTQVEASGALSPRANWKLSARLDVDPIIKNSGFYPEPVREDQRYELMLRETYIDTGVGDWEFRIGRQHIVWGEVVGLFFADVVSARDLRDFILPEFDIMRIPQWAARAEYYAGEAHLELVWIPIASYDDIGEPGAEFYPLRLPPISGASTRILSDDTPARTLSNSNYGIRASYLYKGWDMTAFYYKSVSSYPTFYRELVMSPGPTLEFTPRHDRIWQLGGTVSKDLGPVVLRGETVFTGNKGYEVTRASEADGVVEQDTLDYIVSLDFVPFDDGRLNLQFYQRIFFGHDSDIRYDSLESGVSILLSGKLSARWEPELLIIQSLNRNDRLLRPRVNWYPGQNLRVTLGMDIFAGPEDGDFGRYADNDRIYLEARYAF